MPTNRVLTLFHAPNSRATASMALLEEIGEPYELQVLNLMAGEQKQPGYLLINPMGKVPSLRHGEMVITEQVAIFLYLADLFPEAGLAPQMGDELRGPYLRWMVFYASAFEPAMVDRSQERSPGPPFMSPYGDFDTMYAALNDRLAAGPYILGEQFSAADILWGMALEWTTAFKLLPETPAIMDYVQRVCHRPAIVRAHEKDVAILAAAPPA